MVIRGLREAIASSIPRLAQLAGPRHVRFKDKSRAIKGIQVGALGTSAIHDRYTTTGPGFPGPGL